MDKTGNREINKKKGNIPQAGLIVFLTGITGLGYQLIWIRELGLYFGTHTLSTATVLTIFMAGLSAGAWIAGKLADRIPSPLRLLVFMQLTLGVFALVFHPLFELVKINSGLIIHSKALNQISQFLNCSILLILPSVIMGGTLPLVAKITIPGKKDTGQRMAGLYTMNNLGALTGGLITAFFLIRLYGSTIPGYIMSGINFLAAILSLLFLREIRLHDNPEEKPAENGKTSDDPKLLRLALIIIGIEGFTLLSYEVLWTRILVEFSYDKSSYFYSVIILAFITGLATGGWIMKKIIRRISNMYSWLARIEILVSLSSLFFFVLFSFLAPVIIASRSSGTSWFMVSGKDYIIVFLFLVIPSVFMGMTFPIGASLISRSDSKIGSDIGKLAFIDTFGSVVGPFFTGFILLKFLGVYTSFLVMVLLNFVPSVILLLRSGKTDGKTFRWLSYPVFIIIGLLISLLPSNYIKLKEACFPDEQMIYIDEGQTATVRVNQDRNGHYSLIINGAHTAFSHSEDMRVHIMLAELPALFSTGRENALVIGYGMGVTARCLYEENFQQIEIAEISPEVVEASNLNFNYLNNRVTEKTNVRLYAEDGRSLLTRTRNCYDLITTNAVHPRLGPNLYTREFYMECYKKMHEKSVICQWLPTNWMTEDEIKSLISAFNEVFPSTLLYYINRSHTLLLGSPSSFPSKADIDKNISTVSLKNFAETDIYDRTDFWSRILAGDKTLRTYSLNSIPNSDNRPVVEYSFRTEMMPNISFLKELIIMAGDTTNNKYSDPMSEAMKLRLVTELDNFIKAYGPDHP